MNSWLSSYRNSEFAERIDKEVYFTEHHALIEDILSRRQTKVLIASLTEEPSVILGYIVFESVNGKNRLVHYCYIKKTFRRMGLGRFLLKKSHVSEHFFITHMSRLFIAIFERHRNQITYYPYGKRSREL